MITILLQESSGCPCLLFLCCVICSISLNYVVDGDLNPEEGEHRRRRRTWRRRKGGGAKGQGEERGPLSACIAFLPGCRNAAQNVTFFAADNSE